MTDEQWKLVKQYLVSFYVLFAIIAASLLVIAIKS